VGTGMSRSFNEIIQILNQNLKTNFSPEYFDNPYQGRYQEFTQADIGNLERLLKIKPHYSLEAGIADYIKVLNERVSSLERDVLGEG
ncbi:MAG: hypothetical protein NC928_02990, partial [Candidatus Omnitrophica bacterium]|nr:hypothetical protein [Candidatus Omnitrophota bacterium]